VDDLTAHSATALAGLIAQGQVSALEAIDAYLARIAEHNPSLNAIVTLDEPGARRRAREADAALACGETWGPLHGVPYTLKDVHSTAGIRTTWGHPGYVDNIPAADGPMAARLKRAGGVLLGKTHVALFPENPLGECNNPWDVQRIAGGSSSGAAAAVAAGLAPFDVGTDVTGSILGPSHFCGVYGMRPTERRISADGLTLLEPVFIWHVLMTPGPIARHPEDLELVLQAITGPEGRDTGIPPMPWRTASVPEIADLKIAWSTLDVPLDVPVQSVLDTCIRALSDQGAQVEQCLPNLHLPGHVQVVDQLFFQMVTAFQDGADGQAPPTLADYLFALDRRADLITAWDAFFQVWDLFVCPIHLLAAPAHDMVNPMTLANGREVTYEEQALPQVLAAASGHPSIVIPAGQDDHGMPIGIQLIGRRWDDERLIAMTKAISHLVGGYRQPTMT
jgi:amidase